MVKKYLIGFCVLLGLSIGNVSAQSNDVEFPNEGCKSVDVVYLRGNTGLKLFEVKKQADGVYWDLSKESLKQVDGFTTLEGKDPTGEKLFNSDNVIQRFNFGTEKAPIFKKYCVEFQEAIPVGEKGELAKSIGGDTGIDLVKNYVAMVYKVGAFLIGLVCVLVIVVSGIQISAGGASPDSVSEAKGRIMQALFSLVLLFASAMILKAINPGFFL